jgi:hypothetical protein
MQCKSLHAVRESVEEDNVEEEEEKLAAEQ